MFRNCLQASGHSIQAMIVSIIQCVVRATLAIVLPLSLGIYGVALATPISWYLSGILLSVFVIIYIFKKLPNNYITEEVI